MSTPFFGEEFTFHQPDGTELRVRGWGNQNRAVFETMDGYTVIKDPITGFYQYATLNELGDELEPTGFQAEIANPQALRLSPKIRINGPMNRESLSMGSGLEGRKMRWQTRREIKKMQQRNEMLAPAGMSLAPPQHETTGDFTGLCILVDFSDERGTISQAEVESFCNTSGYANFGNNGSVYEYFLDNSGGKLRYKNIVAAYYTAKHKKSYYTDRRQPFGLRAQELIREALDHLKSIGFDASTLTSDSGDFVYATNVFYAGARVNNWSEGLWPHSSRLSSDYKLTTGKKIADYQITEIGDSLTLGTFCHENGHMICDFPDLYDYGKDGVKSFGIGAYCLMCGGGNINATNPTQINAYLKYRAGWANDLIQISPQMSSSLHSGVNDFLIHRKDMMEYFIIENREKQGRDSFLPGEGMLIWHIDEQGSNENQQMTSQKHYECSLVQADGKFDFEKGINFFGDEKDPFYLNNNSLFSVSTTPHSRWWDGTPSNLEVSNIGAAGAAMNFEADI